MEKAPGQMYLPCMRPLAKRTLRVDVIPEDAVGEYGARYFYADTPGGRMAYWNWPWMKVELERQWGEPLRFTYYCTRTKKALPGEPRVIRGKPLPLSAG